MSNHDGLYAERTLCDKKKTFDPKSTVWQNLRNRIFLEEFNKIIAKCIQKLIQTMLGSFFTLHSLPYKHCKKNTVSTKGAIKGIPIFKKKIPIPEYSPKTKSILVVRPVCCPYMTRSVVYVCVCSKICFTVDACNNLHCESAVMSILVRLYSNSHTCAKSEMISCCDRSSSVITVVCVCACAQ